MGSLKYALVIGKLQLWHLNTNILKVIHEVLSVSLKTIRVQRPQSHPDQNAGGDCLIIQRYFTNITDLISVTVIFCASYSALIVFQELLINRNSTNWTNKATRVIKRITRTNNFYKLQYLSLWLYPTSMYWSSRGSPHCLQRVVSSETATVTISPCGSLLLVFLLWSSLAWCSVLLYAHLSMVTVYQM